ncbi:MAG: hypothetical protein LQ349_009562 [Xanthoria aureola]|nr:MAG: hypothetical protein LQ349_009562 [Xanthoria aureola]
MKAALETDAESKEPVWTAQERTTLEAHLGKWEADVRKGDRWYKKIAWGPNTTWQRLAVGVKTPQEAPILSLNPPLELFTGASLGGPLVDFF